MNKEANNVSNLDSESDASATVEAETSPPLKQSLPDMTALIEQGLANWKKRAADYEKEHGKPMPLPRVP